MQRVQHRSMPEQRAKGISWPVKSVNVYDIKLVAALAQLQKKVKKQVGLRKEALVGCALARLARETARLHAGGNGDGLDSDARHKRCIARKKRYMMAALAQTVRQVSQQSLRPAE